MKIKLITILFSVIIFTQFAFAKGVGTTMFQILQMPTNAYDASLANTSVLGKSSAVTNPAFIPFLERSIVLTHAIYIEGTKYSIGDINFPLNEKSGINFSFSYFDSGEMDRVLESGSGYKSDGTFNASDKVFNLSYGRKFSSSVSMGLTLKYIEQKIDDVSYSNFLAGFNGLYFFTSTTFVAVGIDNFGGEVKGYSMPTKVYCGLTGNVNETTTGTIQIDDYYNEDICEIKVALEKKLDKLALRGGYVIPTKKYSGTNNSFVTNLTLGAGLDFKFLVIDYAWLPKGDLGNVHMFTVRINF
ncbi:MAG: hypothetical protein IKO48_00170 [Elusimicrobia bacterium]|nr:hypothetical protein [Elusimicrobiota bacterium]